MPNEPSLACSLTASQLPARLHEMASLGGEALASVETQETRAVLRFRAAPGVRARLAAILAAEAKCCTFLGMEVREERESLVLTINAPEGTGPVLSGLVAAFSGHAPGRSGGGRG